MGFVRDVVLMMPSIFAHEVCATTIVGAGRIRAGAARQAHGFLPQHLVGVVVVLLRADFDVSQSIDSGPFHVEAAVISSVLLSRGL